jgi:aerobic C4-dicarboxylate transport protein
VLYVQVLIGIALAIVLGHFYPKFAVEMRPFGDAFIKLIKMVIGLIVFFTVVSGIAGMGDLKKVGRVGAGALVYFEVVSTLALLAGMVVGAILQPGGGFNVDPATLDAKSIQSYVGTAQSQHIVDFLLNIIPTTVLGAFTNGDILPVVFVSVLLGYVLARLGDRGKPIRELIDAGAAWVFGAINVLMRLAPVGAFGAMAFTVGRYGVGSLLPLLTLIVAFYITAALFVLVVLGTIFRVACGHGIISLLIYLKEELLITLGTSSSDAALPTLMAKLERMGCPKGVVGLVVPTGYVFNTNGTNIYMTMAVLFVAQATNTALSIPEQLAIFGVAMVTSKGSAGVTGAGFVALVSTVSVIPAIPVAGLGLILGIDRFISEGRALVNVIGNAVAAAVMSRHEGELDRERMREALTSRDALVGHDVI